MHVQSYCFAYKTHCFFFDVLDAVRSPVLSLVAIETFGSPLVRESEFRINFSCGIRSPGFWSQEYRSRNAEFP